MLNSPINMSFADQMETYWLTISEAFSPGEWPPEFNGRDWKVSISKGPSLSNGGELSPFRTSPVFSIHKEFAEPVLKKQTIYLHFLFCQNAFASIAQMQAENSDIEKQLFISLGLASIIVWSSKSLDVTKLGIKPSNLQSWEIWKIDDGFLTDTRCQRTTDRKPDASILNLPNYDILPIPVRATVDEFLAATRLIVGNIVTHIPDELEPFTHLVRCVKDLVVEMVFCCAPILPVPDKLSEYSVEQFLTDSHLAETVLNQAWDRLIQINSGLSYLSTQALSGAPPILERRSLLRRHSLLGVGTAVLALTRLTRTIESAFAAGAVEEIIFKFGRTGTPIPGLEIPAAYDSTNWQKNSINKFFEHTIGPAGPYSKVPYFSGRMGFRETEYTISASLQALTAGISPEWSFLTLTHEMTHGHVRNILNAILQGAESKTSNDKWDELYSCFKRACDEKKNAENLIDSLRNVILAYCCFAYGHGSLSRLPERETKLKGGKKSHRFYLPDSVSLKSILVQEFRNINEILVHILDYHYFYFSRLKTYTQLIWKSWAHLPQVKGDLRQYILRSVLVVATKAEGTAHKRFEDSCLMLNEYLEPLAESRLRGSSTIRNVLDVLSSSSCRDLYLPFAGSLILVDFADKVLMSDIIRSKINGGDNLLELVPDPSSVEDRLIYSLPIEFIDTFVASPTALLADRIGNKVTEYANSRLEAETLLLFLACCASPEPVDVDKN